MQLDEVTRTIQEATGARPRVLDTGGGCRVIAWRSADFVCWLSDEDAGVPTDEEYGLVLGIYEPDATEDLWPSEACSEGLRYFYADAATPQALAALLVEAKGDVLASFDDAEANGIDGTGRGLPTAWSAQASRARHIARTAPGADIRPAWLSDTAITLPWEA